MSTPWSRPWSKKGSSRQIRPTRSSDWSIKEARRIWNMIGTCSRSSIFCSKGHLRSSSYPHWHLMLRWCSEELLLQSQWSRSSRLLCLAKEYSWWPRPNSENCWTAKPECSRTWPRTTWSWLRPSKQWSKSYKALKLWPSRPINCRKIKTFGILGNEFILRFQEFADLKIEYFYVFILLKIIN